MYTLAVVLVSMVVALTAYAVVEGAQAIADLNRISDCQIYLDRADSRLETARRWFPSSAVTSAAAEAGALLLRYETCRKYGR